MQFQTTAISFNVNYYKFDPKEISATVQRHPEGIPNLTEVFKKQFHLNGDFDAIGACKYTESVLGHKMVNSGYSKEESEAYLLFLLELNRFDELYKLSDELYRNASEADKGTFKEYMCLAALHMEEPDLIQHLMPAKMAPNASYTDWMLYIQYKYLKGQQHELLLKPLPQDYVAKQYLYYICDEFWMTITLCTGDDVSHDSLWLRWLAATRIGLKEPLLNTLLLSDNIISYFIEELVFDELGRTQNLRKEIAHYLEKRKQTRPFTPGLLLLFANFADDPNIAALYRARARKLSASFKSLFNKRILILAGDGDESQKMDLWAKTAEAAKPHMRMLSEIFRYLTPQNERLLAYCRAVESHPQAIMATRISAVSVAANRSETEAEKRAVLVRIDEILALVPYCKPLLLYKVKLHIALNEWIRAEEIATEFVTTFDANPGIAILLNRIYTRTGQIDKAIEVLKRSFHITPSDKCFFALCDHFKNHKSGIDYVRMLAEFAFVGESNMGKDEILFDEARAIIEEMDDPDVGINILKSVRRGNNRAFIKQRMLFFHHKMRLADALKDAEFLSHRDPTFLSNKISIFIDMGSLKEAYLILINNKIAFGEIYCEDLILAMDELGGYESCIVSLWERYKPANQDVKLAAAFAYLVIDKPDKALPIFNELYKINPEDIQILSGRISCYKTLKRFTQARDDLSELIKLAPDDESVKFLELDLDHEEAESQKKEEKEEVKPSKPTYSRPAIDPKKLPHLIEEKKEKSTARIQHEKQKEERERRVEKTAMHHQKSAKHAVNPLEKNPELKAIKELARKGEKQVDIEPQVLPLAPTIAVPKQEAPKLLVKTRLNKGEKDFLGKAHEVLRVAMSLEMSLPGKVITNNYLYALLRVFTPIRLNALNSSLKEDLARIRDDARHASDLVHDEKLTTLFTYLREINLAGQIGDWVEGKSVITRIFLRPYTIVREGERKTSLDRIIEELNFIKAVACDKEAFLKSAALQNACKASVSIIGEASNSASHQLRPELAEYREEGNRIAHQFFETVETLEARFVYQDDISPEPLWDLCQKGIVMFEKLTGKSHE